MARRKVSLHPSSSTPISIGNFQVVEAKDFTSGSHQNGLQISLSKTAKIRISVMEEREENDDSIGIGSNERGGYYFVLANPKDTGDQIKSLLQEVLNLYMKELPAMSYASNTGKESMFLERCLTNGKYCTLILKSQEDRQRGEVIAAITYQIVPADTQCAEIPLAAVTTSSQHKGIGHMIYLELKKRLQSVGIQTLFCWGDKESKGFWLKQGFKVIGEVNKKGRARKLHIKASIRKALCFPGDSTLMVSYLLNDTSSKSVVNFPLASKLPKLNFPNQETGHIPESDEASEGGDLLTRSQCSEFEKLTEKASLSGCQEVGLLSAKGVANASGLVEGGTETNLRNFSCLVPAIKRRTWEASCTSLKSKKVKGTHSSNSQMGSECPVWTSNGRIINCSDINCLLNSGNNYSSDICLKNPGSHSRFEISEKCTAANTTHEDYSTRNIPSAANRIRIMLMDIADDKKKVNLTKVIEALGGFVTSDGSVSTHVVTGKVRATLNFCAALSSGSWVVSPAWLKESFKKGKLVDEMPFVLDDEDYRTKYRTELKYAVLRAKTSPSSLLKGLDIWLAMHVQPPARTLSDIVKYAGGNVIWTESEIKNTSTTIFVACEEDMEEALLAVKLGIWSFSVDWLMNCIMKQELDLDAPQFAESL